MTDLIASLSGKLGIPADQAQALAGSVLGTVQGALGNTEGEEAASSFGKAIPELNQWTEAAKAQLPTEGASDPLGALTGLLGGGSSSTAGGLLGGALGALDSARDITALAGILSKLGLDTSHATMVAPLVLDFLKDRLDPALLQQALAVAPMLTGGGASDGLASALGGLGGLFGK